MMKKLFALLWLSPALTFAQVTFDLPKEQKKNYIFSISLQTALGFINPQRVNAYIDEDIANRLGGGFIFETGSSEIKVAASLNLSFTFKLGEHWKVRIPFEYGGASKNVSVDYDAIRYRMNRFSFGALGYYYHEVEENVALFIGGGVLRHGMSFDGKKATAMSPRIELGVSSQGRTADREVFLLFDSANGITGEGISPYEINFTGLYFGIRISF